MDEITDSAARANMDAIREQLRPVTTGEFAKALFDAGIIRNADKVTRIVIDARENNWVRLYVERVGDRRLIDVVPALAGVTVTEAP